MIKKTHKNQNPFFDQDFWTFFILNSKMYAFKISLGIFRAGLLNQVAK